MKPRDNLSTKYPRCHYNKLGKTKMTFDTTDLAEKYIKKMQLDNYTIYQCTYCNKYHISHTQIKKNRGKLANANSPL